MTQPQEAQTYEEYNASQIAHLNRVIAIAEEQRDRAREQLAEAVAALKRIAGDSDPTGEASSILEKLGELS